MTNYNGLPEHMQDAARGYIEEGLHPGGFLLAVLENNLVDAFGRADDVNRVSLSAWTSWLMWDIPANAWGSKDKIKAYVKAIQEERNVTVN